MTRLFKHRIRARGWMLTGVVIAGVMVWIGWWFVWPFRESGRWARAFAAVETGTPAEQVERKFQALSPRYQSRWGMAPESVRPNWVPTNAVSVLYYGGPHNWHYQFFVDEQQTIAGKLKHWD